MSDTTAPEIASLITRVHLGEPVPGLPIALVPLLADGELNVDLLPEAMAAGRATVTEVGQARDVNAVRLRHAGASPLLLLHGEEVVGAKQNRMFNASFLISPGSEVTLPVSCLERGRWAYRSSQFTASGSTAVSRTRSSSLDRVARSVTSRGSYDADQSRVWDDVDTYLSQSRTSSRTSSHSDGVRSRMAAVERALAIIQPAPQWSGFAFVLDGRIIGLDLFGSPAIFARAWREIAVGVLADALEGPVSVGDPSAHVAAALAVIGKTPVFRHRGTGMGETLHGSGPLSVGAVVDGGRLYHLYAAGA